MEIKVAKDKDLMVKKDQDQKDRKVVAEDKDQKVPMEDKERKITRKMSNMRNCERLDKKLIILY